MLTSTSAMGVVALAALLAACDRSSEPGEGRTEMASSGQAAVSDDVSAKTIARIAAESPDHTTLVAALKAVSYVDPLANPGPFTVFAPVNAAFDKLPAGTVDDLLKPENASKLRSILLHHVTTSAWAPSDLAHGLEIGMVDGGPITVARTGETISVDGATVVASVRAGNGWVHVIDGVLLKKE